MPGASHTTRQSRPCLGCVPAMTNPIFRYRTPLCVLYPPKIIAAACYILSQRIVDGPHSLSLDARVSPLAPSASLPTPPTHKASSPDASRFAIEFFGLRDDELLSVGGTCVVGMRLLSLKEFMLQMPWPLFLISMGTKWPSGWPITSTR